jgi:hypothetical protein
MKNEQIISLSVSAKTAKNEQSISESSNLINQTVPDELDYKNSRSAESCEDLTVEKAMSVTNQTTIKKHQPTQILPRRELMMREFV